MKIKRVATAGLTALAILAALACGGAATPSNATPTGSASSVVGTPVPRSELEAAFAKPLSSGLSVADVVENALPSVVQITAGSDSGTGFIVNESGLVVTNKHVVQGASRVTLRLVNGNEYRGDVTQRHASLDLAYVEIDATQSFTPLPLAIPTKSVSARRLSPSVSP